MTRGTLLVLICAPLALWAGGAQNLKDTYFAPDNQIISSMVTPDGVRRQFQRDLSTKGGFFGAEGWKADVSDGGQRAEVIHFDGKRMLERFVFENGRLRSHQKKGESAFFKYEEPRSAITNMVTPLAMIDVEASAKAASEYKQNEISNHWLGTGRLAFPFINPNQSGALYVEIALLSLLLCCFGRKALLIVGTLLFATSVVCVVLTGSRGSLLGLVAGLAVYFSVYFKKVGQSRFFWCSVASVVIGLTAWFLGWGAENLTRGFEAGGISWSNQIRIEMWKTAPRMIHDAPGGWGFCSAGRAFFDWYMPREMICLTGSLMNDHLTTLVQIGWFGRLVYLALAFVIVGLGLYCLVCHRKPVLLSVWVAFGVMAFFNPVFDQVALWVIPVGSLAAIARVSWGKEGRCLGWISLSSVLMGALVLVAICWVGAGESADGRLAVAAEGNRVLINGQNPKIWVVDDGGGAIGGYFVGRDIRSFYAQNPHGRPIGYVHNIKDIPRTSVERLVLVGKAGFDWLTELSENEAARQNLPQSVLFVSPPFSPSAVPEGVLMMCRPRILVGEFAARFDPEYANPAAWITVVPAMERYVMPWMWFAVGG